MNSRSPTPLTQKLASLVSLSAADTAVLDALQAPTRSISRNRELFSARGQPCGQDAGWSLNGVRINLS